MNPKEKTVWITGASSGIGEALALKMAGAGARLILSARREDKLRDVALRCEEMGAQIHVLPFDLGDLPSLRGKAHTAWDLFGGIDILVNNAGITQRATALKTTLEVDRLFMDVNYFGTVALTKAILRGMIRRGGGQFVVTSSVLGKIGVQNRTSYAASKHALHGFFDSLRCEMAQAGHPIRITMVCPGWVGTNISVHAHRGDGTRYNISNPEPNIGMSPEKFADKMLKAIIREKEEVAIGGNEVRAILLKRFAPGLLNRILPRTKIT